MPLVPHQECHAVRPPAPLVPPPTEAPTTLGLSSAPAAVGLSSSTAAAGGPGPDEVVVKKAALVMMKHQMAALIWGEELPAPQPGARDVPEVPYAMPAVGRDDTKCPVCHLSFKMGYHLRKHMDVHWGEQFPCGSCNKLLASCWMLREHEKGCTQGSRYSCDQCDKDYATKQGLRQHTRAVHGPDRPALDEVFLCPHCAKAFKVKKSMREHVTTCSQNPARKGPFFCQVEGCPSKDHPFSRIKNLNAHMSSCHGWKEHQQ